MINLIESLKELNIVLPKANKPVANYSAYVIVNNKIYISGQIPIKNGKLIYQGKIGKEIKLSEGVKSAEICMINTLAVLNLATNNNLDRVKSCIKINVFLNSTDDFFDQPIVADGASNLLRKIFKNYGDHARSAVSCNSLPKNASVEIDSIFQLKD